MSDDEFRRMLDVMSAEFRGGLPERLAGIDDLWGKVARGEEAAAALPELVRALHTLAGSAATFGQDAVGKAAAAAESRLQSCRETGTLMDHLESAEITRLLDVLRGAAGECSR